MSHAMGEEWVFDHQSNYYYNSRTGQYSYWDGQAWQYSDQGSSSYTGNGYFGSSRRREDHDRHYDQSRHSDKRDYRNRDHGREPKENDRKRQRIAEPEEQASVQPVASTLRLVKLSSGVLPADKKIAIVDTNGVSIGRDRSYDARIRLSEMATSKFHCQIYFDSVGEQRGFYVCDSGSVNGTFLQKQEDNDKESSSIRLSKSKEASKPFLLSHKDQLTVGTTTFEVHLHLKWQCDDCSVRDDNEISLVHSKTEGSEASAAAAAAAAQADANDATTSSWLAMKASINKKGGKPLRKRAQLDEIRKVQLKKMRAEFDAQSDGEEKSTETDKNSQAYNDRAALRRKQLGQSEKPIREKARDTTPPISAESASVNVPISQDNKGHALLSKMGWAQGNAIGTTGDGGLVDPINVTKMATARAGLGSIQAQPAEDKPWGGTKSASNSKTDPRFQEWKNRTKDALARRYEELKRE